jgi:hypothetical protein
MNPLLLLTKRLFLLGSSHADEDDPISSGMAISVFQDAVEIFIWSLIKDLDAPAKDNAPFTSFFDLVENAPKNTAKKQLPLKAKMLELNKARVNFKHYGNLPDRSESVKFRAYTEQFFIVAFNLFHGLDFEELSFVDLIGYPDLRETLKSAETNISKEDFKNALQDLATAKHRLFEKVGAMFPRMDEHQLRDADKIFSAIPGLRGTRIFGPVAAYLKQSREFDIASMLGISLNDYVLIQHHLPVVMEMMSGNLRFSFNPRPLPGNKVCERIVRTLSDAAIQYQKISGPLP